MIDRKARNSIAEATRHYLSGLSTNFVFDDTIFDIKSGDPSIRAIQDQLWLIYDDLREHKHEGQWLLSKDQREIVLRIIMFLKSDVEYQWPIVPGWYVGLRPVIWLVTFSIGAKYLDQMYNFQDKLDVWPFKDQIEIKETQNDPKYLASAT